MPLLTERLAQWSARLRQAGAGVPPIGDVPAGAFWGGLISDLEKTMQILNLREFGEWLRTHGPDEHRQFATEILDQAETIEAYDDAVNHAAERHGLGEWADPVAAVEALDGKAKDYEAIRSALVDIGALGEDDDETPVADLVRALLA